MDNIHDTIQCVAVCTVVGAIAWAIAWGNTATSRAAIAAGCEQQVVITSARPWESPHIEVVWRKAPAPALVITPEVEKPK